MYVFDVFLVEKNIALLLPPGYYLLENNNNNVIHLYARTGALPSRKIVDRTATTVNSDCVIRYIVIFFQQNNTLYSSKIAFCEIEREIRLLISSVCWDSAWRKAKSQRAGPYRFLCVPYTSLLFGTL